MDAHQSNGSERLLHSLGNQTNRFPLWSPICWSSFVTTTPRDQHKWCLAMDWKSAIQTILERSHTNLIRQGPTLGTVVAPKHLPNPYKTP